MSTRSLFCALGKRILIEGHGRERQTLRADGTKSFRNWEGGDRGQGGKTPYRKYSQVKRNVPRVT